MIVIICIVSTLENTEMKETIIDNLPFSKTTTQTDFGECPSRLLFYVYINIFIQNRIILDMLFLTSFSFRIMSIFLD